MNNFIVNVCAVWNNEKPYEGRIIEMSNKDTYNFEFWPENKYDDPVRLSYDINPEDMHCAKIHKMCKAFAIVLGYSPETVEKYFGKTSYDDML